MDPVVIAVVALAALVIAVTVVFLVLRGGRSVPIHEDGPGAPVSAPGGLGVALRRVFSGGIDGSTWTALEDALLGADVGPGPTSRILESVRSRSPKTAEEARELLGSALAAEFVHADRALNLWGQPSVVLVLGVNGAGKTTTVAKLAYRLVAEGKSVLLAAADTFRAAGSEQLEIWGKRIGLQVVAGQEGGDAAAVVYDALASARASSIDVVIVDTAGRLHGNRNLMEELSKVHRVAGGEGGVGEVLLVLDATAGQNGLAQVKEFGKAVPVTGVVLAKLDGSAKGGIVVAVESGLGVPVKLVGTGEQIGDLEPFDPLRFVASLLSV